MSSREPFSACDDNDSDGDSGSGHSVLLQGRPEIAPAMGAFSCASLSHFIASFKGDKLYAGDDLSNLSIMDASSLNNGSQNVLLLETMQYLCATKTPFLHNVLSLRRKAMRCKENTSHRGIGNEKTENAIGPTRSLRLLDMVTCLINDSGLEEIASFINGNSTLSSLRLTHNRYNPTRPLAMHDLAQALNLSNLCRLTLSSNHIGPRSMVQFLDNLDMPTLAELTLSSTMQRGNHEEDQRRNPLWKSTGIEEGEDGAGECSDAVWKREISRVANSFVNIISNSRIKGKGYLPRLERLHLNGNDLGWRAVEKIVASIIDTNRTLIEVELFATVDPDDSDDEEDEFSDKAGPSLRRIISIGTLYYQNKQAGRTNHGKGNATPPRSAALQNASTARAHLTKVNWRGELGCQLWANRLSRGIVKDASRYLLPIVRTLTCKCRPNTSNSSDSSFPFTSLPPEIRARIVSFLNDGMVLSAQQMKRVISFASNPATLGYGCKSANLGLSNMAFQQIKREAQGIDEEEIDDYGLIPHHPWSWKEMMQNSPMPRDWPATILDDGLRRKAKPEEGDDDHRDIQGLGGGGPDGRGGLTYERHGPDAARRRWLEEQSGLHAYWETTGTYRAE